MGNDTRSSYRVVYVVGSLAKGSINRQLAGALVKLAPPELSFTEAPIAALPLYSYDFDSALPRAGAGLQAGDHRRRRGAVRHPRVQPLDPGRPQERHRLGQPSLRQEAFAGKRCGVIGASPGKIGTAAAQQHLKNILNYCDAVLMNQPEAYIQFTKGLIAADGAVTDETTAGFLRTYMGRFGAFVAAGADRADAVRA